MSDPVADPAQSPAWQSYLVPGTDVLRNLAELSDPSAAAIYERLLSGQADAAIRRSVDRPRTLDLAHLNDIHERLFADVYPFAGQLRYVDVAKPGQSGEPFLHYRWIETYTAAVTEQLRVEGNLAGLGDAGQWADRAAYYWAAWLHAHPYREGSGRAARLWMGDLAAAAGHQLDWSRGSVERNTQVSVAAGHGDYEPMRALLTVAAGGSLGVDRQITALDDLDKLLRGQAWARTGLVFGTDEERETLRPRLAELGSQIAAVRHHLSVHPERAVSREQPPAERWRGLVASIRPDLTAGEDWLGLAADLDAAAEHGVDVSAELPTLAGRRQTATSGPRAAEPTAVPAARERHSADHHLPVPGPGHAAAAGSSYRPGVAVPAARGPRR